MPGVKKIPEILSSIAFVVKQISPNFSRCSHSNADYRQYDLEGDTKKKYIQTAGKNN